MSGCLALLLERKCSVLPVSQDCLKSQDVVGLLKVLQFHVLMTTKTISQKQCEVIWDTRTPIWMQNIVLRGKGRAVTWAYFPYNCPECPMRKLNEAYWLTIDYPILKLSDPNFGCCCPRHAPDAVSNGSKTRKIICYHEHDKSTLLHSHSRVIYTTVCFHLIHLESITCRVET